LATLFFKKLANIFGRKQGFVTIYSIFKISFAKLKKPIKNGFDCYSQIAYFRLNWMSTHEAP
jgi:hypothetical protein